MNVLILGMHRSGTSAMSEAMRASGFMLGNRTSLGGAHESNPRGHFELSEVVQLNDTLLRSLGWSWDAPSPEPLAFAPARDALVSEGRTIVERELGQRGPWVLKDPRISLLLPWWRRILLDRFAVVVMVRPPAEVAWSLWVRDGLPLPLGHVLWAAYYRHLAKTLEGLPVVVVDYVALLEQPDTVMVSVLEGLSRVGVNVPEPATEQPQSVIDAVLRRPSQPLTPAGSTSADEIQRIVAAWSMAPVTVIDHFSMEVPPPTDWEIGILQIQRGRRDAEASVKAAQEELRAMSVRADAAKAESAAFAESARHLRGEVARSEADAQELRTALAKREVNALATFKTSPRGFTMVARALMGTARDLALRFRILIGLPNPLFDVDWYRLTYPAVPRDRLRAWLHWRRHGWREGRDPEPLFDTVWYLARYADVRARGMDPLAHYVLHGAREGRDPSPRFDTGAYLARYPDVLIAGVVPLLHYRRYGASEGRMITTHRDTPTT